MLALADAGVAHCEPEAVAGDSSEAPSVSAAKPIEPHKDERHPVRGAFACVALEGAAVTRNAECAAPLARFHPRTGEEK